MAVQEITIVRGGKEYTQYIGIDESNNSVLYIESVELDNASGQPIRFYPKELSIKFDTGEGKGGVAYIYTTWEESLIGATGKPIRNTGSSRSMKTNNVDQSIFITKFGIPILMSIDNGFIRAILGFNNLPIFDTTTGAVLEYTTEEENLPSTNDY